MAYQRPPVKQDVRQIVDADGKPFLTCATSPLGGNQDKDYKSFGMITEGNTVKPLTTGKDYFDELVSAINSASYEALIAGWQINWDALLAAPKVRLLDVISSAAKRGVKFYLMPWDDTAPVETYDDQTKAVFAALDGRLTSDPNAKGGRVFTLLAPSNADGNTIFYSNHQKQVVIDRKRAFVGGMDLAYGRYDDATFNLDINAGPAARVALNRYNPCIAQVGTLAADVVCDPNLLQGPWDSISGNATRTWNQIASGAHQTPYGTDRDKTIEPGRQPRMPWQDVHCLIVGPAVSDVTLNFVLRWNAIIEHLESTDELAWTRLVGYRLPHPDPADTYPKRGPARCRSCEAHPRSCGPLNTAPSPPPSAGGSPAPTGLSTTSLR